MVKQHVIKVLHTPVTIDTATNAITFGVQEEITGVSNANVEAQIGKTADTFSFRISDVFGGVKHYWWGKVNPADLITIYSSDNAGSTWTTEMSGVVKQVGKQFDPNNFDTTVSGLNRLELLLGTISPVASGAGQTKTADYWIRLILREVNTAGGYADYSGDTNGEPTVKTIHRSDKYIYGGLLSEWTSVGNSTGTINTPTDFYRGDQIAFETIETLSGERWAGFNAMFYIDQNNYFRWVQMSNTSAGHYPLDHQSTRINHEVTNDYNYVIVVGGNNLYGNASIKNFKYDLVRATENGIRAKVVYLDGVSAQCTTELRQFFVNTKNYDQTKFPFALTYPTSPPPQWYARDSIGSDAALNSAFVDEVYRRLDQYADTFLQVHAQSGYKVDYELPDGVDQHAYTIAGYYTDDFLGEDIRVVGVSRNFTMADGWRTSLKMEEDFDKL